MDEPSFPSTLPESPEDDLCRALRGFVLDLGSGAAGSSIDPSSERSVLAVGAARVVTVDKLDFPPARPSLLRIKGDLDGNGLPFRDGSFDAVVCAHVLEHVRRPQSVLREMARVLMPGGLAVVAVPNGWSLSDNLYKLWKGFFWLTKQEPVPHVQRFTRTSIERLFARSGFAIVARREIGETYEWLAKHPTARRVLRRVNRVLRPLRPSVFLYGWHYVLRQR